MSWYLRHASSTVRSDSLGLVAAATIELARLLGHVVACVLQLEVPECWVQFEVPDNVIDGQRKNPITIVRLV